MPTANRLRKVAEFVIRQRSDIEQHGILVNSHQDYGVALPQTRRKSAR